MTDALELAARFALALDPLRRLFGSDAGIAMYVEDPQGATTPIPIVEITLRALHPSAHEALASVGVFPVGAHRDGPALVQGFEGTIAGVWVRVRHRHAVAGRASA